ncbi:hypothetical protein FQZ97_492380 [compost metagenome]
MFSEARCQDATSSRSRSPPRGRAIRPSRCGGMPRTQWMVVSNMASASGDASQVKTIAVLCAMLKRADSYSSSHDSISR